MPRLTPTEDATMCLIRRTAEKLWDVAETIFNTGEASADDWEEARLAASLLLVELQRPPEQTDRNPLYLRGKPPQSVV